MAQSYAYNSNNMWWWWQEDNNGYYRTTLDEGRKGFLLFH